MDILLYLAGALQLGIASANFVAVKMLRYPEAVAALPSSVRQVFWVQNVYIVLTVVGLSLACFAYPGELSSGAGLGRGLSGFLTLFWGTRLGVQLFYYSPEERRRRRAIDLLFVGTFVYLTGVFAVAAIGR
ncbi:hypothetical protein [Alienimonas chondri]|uniref:Uncharacterized protein n=1 Tax=Alienimonas chondri TaxID=2681879 RepID=A0ABX1V8Q4_9PLAN|nr:hypothetical protein [Alienimonas chondri]NNJ24356.1 hypothetical protein [Alienimonas chondri]